MWSGLRIVAPRLAAILVEVDNRADRRAGLAPVPTPGPAERHDAARLDRQREPQDSASPGVPCWHAPQAARNRRPPAVPGQRRFQLHDWIGPGHRRAAGPRSDPARLAPSRVTFPHSTDAGTWVNFMAEFEGHRLPAWYGDTTNWVGLQKGELWPGQRPVPQCPRHTGSACGTTTLTGAVTPRGMVWSPRRCRPGCSR